jgi:opacity protein-like surface antigen
MGDYPMYNEMILGLVRHLLTIAGSVLVAKGVLSTGAADTLIGSVLNVAGIVWSMVQKKQQQEHVQVALNTPIPTPVPEPAPEPVPAPRPAGFTKTLGFALVLLLVPTLALAAGPPERQKQIGVPYSNPDQVPFVVGSFYVGAAIGNAVEFDDNWFAGGIMGYKAKLTSGLVLGIEADFTRRFTNLEYSSELDNWTFSVRPLVGYLVAPNLLPFVTAGPSWKGSDFDFTFGGGLELGLTEKTSVRFEVLHFNQDDSNVARAAYFVRF